MPHFKFLALAGLGLLGALASAQTPSETPPAPAAPAYFKEVGNIVGKAGTQNSDGSYRINIPRSDYSFKNSNDMPIPEDLGLATYIALSGSAERSLAVGDVAVLQGEIDGVIDVLRAGGFEVVALHNHMTEERPRLFFMHFQAIGKPSDLAKTFKAAVNKLGKETTPKPRSSGRTPDLVPDALQANLGTKPQIFPSGVIRFSNPRKDLTVTVNDLSFTPGMGLASWAAFHGCECGFTMVMGDTCCKRGELQRVIDALRKGGIHITSIHNHTLGISQEVIFLHYEGEGNSLELAQTIKSCWNVLGKN